jgi:hypothetical protein
MEKSAALAMKQVNNNADKIGRMCLPERLREGMAESPEMHFQCVSVIQSGIFVNGTYYPAATSVGAAVLSQQA